MENKNKLLLLALGIWFVGLLVANELIWKNWFWQANTIKTTAFALATLKAARNE